MLIILNITIISIYIFPPLTANTSAIDTGVKAAFITKQVAVMWVLRLSYAGEYREGRLWLP